MIKGSEFMQAFKFIAVLAAVFGALDCQASFYVNKTYSTISCIDMLAAGST